MNTLVYFDGDNSENSSFFIQQQSMLKFLKTATKVTESSIENNQNFLDRKMCEYRRNTSWQLERASYLRKQID